MGIWRGESQGARVTMSKDGLQAYFILVMSPLAWLAQAVPATCCLSTLDALGR